MSKLTDYTKDEIDTIKTHMRLRAFGVDLGRELTDKEILGFIDTYTGQRLILGLRVQSFKKAVKTALKKGIGLK